MFIFISLLVLIKLGSPIIFSQYRVGKDEKVFKIFKFRTMLDLRDEHGNFLADEKRMNSLGLMLRKSGLDELPELFNVLCGEMSLVGPRPLLTDYLTEYSDFHKNRHNVRPGITGLAQVNGRNAVTWKERLDTDVKYVDHYGFFMDIKILTKTLWIILTLNGSTPKNGVVMEEYKRESHESK